MAGGIFINYRRDDSHGTAGRLRDRLVRDPRSSHVFMDVDNIPAGVDFVEYLNDQVAGCDVLLAVIGPNWLHAKDDTGQRRLDSSGDYVREEIAVALARKIRLVPVLVDGARMPRADELPDDLKPLVRRNAVELRNAHFGRDADALADNILEERKPGRAGKGRWIALGASAAMLLLLLAGWIGLQQLGVAVPWPWPYSLSPSGIPGDAALGHRGVTRPLRPGVSVASVTSGAGTLCCFVRDSQGRNYMLSTDQVFAGEEGAPVLQPGPSDGGTARNDQVAKLAQIRRAEPDVGNQVAGAIAELLPNIGFVQEVAGIGPITVVADRVAIGDRLRAVGRASGLVEGRVQAVDVTATINIGGGESRRFEGMIVASPMTANGDGGAPVFNERDELVGMVYAGSPTTTLVMPLAPVLEAFGVELAVD